MVVVVFGVVGADPISSLLMLLLDHHVNVEGTQLELFLSLHGSIVALLKRGD